MDVEKALLSSMLKSTGIGEVIEGGITDAFFEGPAREVWAWCKGFYLKYQATPGETALSTEFPVYQLDTEAREPLTYYMDRLKKKFVHNQLMDGMRACAKSLAAGKDPFEAQAALRNVVLTAEDATSETRDVDWTQTQLQRFEQYERAKEAGGILGVPLPFAELNKRVCGLNPGDLVLVSAPSGTGKTFFLNLCAHHAWVKDYSIVFLSKEMPVFQIGRRLDAIHYTLPFGDLRTGDLSEKAEVEWKRRFEELKGRKPFIINDDPGGGVSHVAAKFEKHRPGLGCVDGAYLLESDNIQSESDWLRLLEVSRGLKIVARRSKVPTMISVQIGSSEEIARSKGMKNDADLWIDLRQDDDDRTANRMWVNIRKQRDGRVGRFPVYWDVDSARFSDAEPEDSPHNEGGQQDVPF